MPTSPTGNVFPALVVVGHIVTLIAVWRWRVCTKQGKTSWNSLLTGLFQERSPLTLTWRLFGHFLLAVLPVESALLSWMFPCEHVWFLLPPLFFPFQFPVLTLNPITAFCSMLPNPKALQQWP
ncbi:unnamed protein product [Tetraodon nigroviridis]|uniref:(spotted green pufferfish) hypothetical protein n=1 Tax=Tetraodon nigroviridis TaxID=99883 RepID=Q4SY66_TETNG|nr:unnamed protein product [Tetraodon nigroviridis]